MSIFIDKVMKRCRHFGGVKDQRCKADVAYDEVVIKPDIPCLGRGGCCSKYDPYTQDEADKMEDENNKEYVRMLAVIEAIKTDSGGKRGIANVITCPVCGGKLAYSIARCNGHIWANCSTDGCVRFMQ